MHFDFTKNIRVNGDAPTYKSAVMICITARVGSTALVSALSRYGLADEIHEIFNDRWIMKVLADRFSPISTQDYVNKYAERFMKTDTVIFKTNYWDFSQWVGFDNIYKLFPDLKFIYLYRNDIIAQGYSLWKANEYNVWHKTRKDSDKAITVSPDDLAILRSCFNLQKEIMHWRRFFDRGRITPLNLSYERFRDDQKGATEEVIRFITGEAPSDVPSPEYVRSSDDRDAEIIDDLRGRLRIG